MWTCKLCGAENPDNFAFCPTCGSARPAPSRPAQPETPVQPVIGRHMRPEDREDAQRGVDDDFWAGLEKAMSDGEDEPIDAVVIPEPEDEEEEEEDEQGGRPLLIALLIFAFLLIVFATVAALILIDRSRNAAPETDVVYQTSQSVSSSQSGGSVSGSGGSTGSGSYTGNSSNNSGDSAGSASADGTVVAGIIQDTVVATPIPTTVPTPAPVVTTAPVYTPTPTAMARQEQDYILVGSDSRYLTTADLRGLSWEECTLARNEIYARHGYIFGVQALDDYFNSKDWYSGTVYPRDFDSGVLNAYEKENAVFILNYEKSQWGGSRY